MLYQLSRGSQKSYYFNHPVIIENIDISRVLSLGWVVIQIRCNQLILGIRAYETGVGRDAPMRQSSLHDYLSWSCACMTHGGEATFTIA